MSANGHSGYVDPNFPNPNGPGDTVIIIYGYRPSPVLAILALVLFALSGITHSIQLYMHRTFYFSILVLVGIAFEVAGYICRALSAIKDPYNLYYYVCQYFFIVVAPVFLSASIYAVLSVLINRIGREYTPILSPRTVLGVFVSCDVISTIVQITGAALIGVEEGQQKSATWANNILLGGLAFQVFSFFVFLVLLSIFLWKARRIIQAELKGFTIAFVSAALLVYLRTCYRLAETAEGLFSKLSTHEVYFGCLEFMPIVLAIIILTSFHPGWCIPTVFALGHSGGSNNNNTITTAHMSSKVSSVEEWVAEPPVSRKLSAHHRIPLASVFRRSKD